MAEQGAPPALVELPFPKSLPILSAHAQFCVVIEGYRIETSKRFAPEDLERVVRVLGRI